MTACVQVGLSPLEAAQRYVRLGLSVIPIRADGSKAPAVDSWKEFMGRRPTQGELLHWYGNGHQYGIGIICGEASGQLEVMDFDSGAAYEAWRVEVLTANPAALDGLGCVRTPSGGHHLYLFRTIAGPCRKLARTSAGKTLVEVKGEGGYVIAPGSPGACHPSGKCYEWERPLTGW
jgi:hypothetical protein